MRSSCAKSIANHDDTPDAFSTRILHLNIPYHNALEIVESLIRVESKGAGVSWGNLTLHKTLNDVMVILFDLFQVCVESV